MTAVILPGATLGVLGGGQLGRMFASAAKQLGYRVAVLSDEADSPAAQIADDVQIGPYDDLDAVTTLASRCAVVTFEFENIALDAAKAAAAAAPCHPSPDVLAFCQDRVLEKARLRSLGLPTVKYATAAGAEELSAAAAEIGFPCIIKTARSGYDGKGQSRLNGPDDLAAALGGFGEQTCVVEKVCEFDAEFSVVAARGADGRFAHYEPSRNEHESGILDLSVVPSGLSPKSVDRGVEIARTLLDAANYVGVACLEFFAAGDDVVVNEIAPRPHNSGHWTIDACAASQFEQQVRAICGLPLGDVRRRGAAALANLLGELWLPDEPDWSAALATTGARLHLYGKQEPRPGRKMGHLTCVADDPVAARRTVVAARDALRRRGAG